MKKVLFIDRDGTLLCEPPDEQIDDIAKLEFLPGAVSALSRIAQLDFELVLVTNQDGLGSASFPEATFWLAQNLMMSVLASEGVHFSEVLIDRSLPRDRAPTRKPGTAMLSKYLEGGYDLASSFVIGDRESDVQLARNLGTQAIQIATEQRKDVVLATQSWARIADFLSFQSRHSELHRVTKETDVRVGLVLDGVGSTDISTGLGFFDHMLSQIGRHGGFDLSIQATGDLHVDEHHLVEDVALTLGQAMNEALGDKRGVDRYGFLVCMDDALSHMALDLSGRSYLVWDAPFLRERIGDMPTELFEHFFRSFCDSARCNLNVKTTGSNEHHKIESIFKALGKCLRQAVRRESGSAIPSTKGSL